MALLLIGATLADWLLQKGFATAGFAVPAVACALRLGVLPLLFLLAARYLPLSVELKRVIVIQAAMPCAVLPIVLARHYRGDAAVALQAVLATSVLGLLTIPWWIRFGLHFVRLQ
jgi:predicted permease